MTPEDVWFPIFCDFCKPVIGHPVYTLSPCTSPDSGPAYDILNRADVADFSCGLRCEDEY